VIAPRCAVLGLGLGCAVIGLDCAVIGLGCAVLGCAVIGLDCAAEPEHKLTVSGSASASAMMPALGNRIT